MRPCLLKSDEKFLKYFTFGTSSGPGAQKTLFCHKTKNFESTSKWFTDPYSVHWELSSYIPVGFYFIIMITIEIMITILAKVHSIGAPESHRKVIWSFHPNEVWTVKIICDKANIGATAKQTIPFMTVNFHEMINNVGLIF